MNNIARTQAQLGNALRSYRKQHHLTQAELGAHINKRQATISNLESAGGGTTLETLFAVLNALELELVVQPRKRDVTVRIGDLF